MASGIKGAAKPIGGSPAYGNPALVTADAATTVRLSACNQSQAFDFIKVAVVPASVSATAGSIGAEYYIEYDAPIPANSAHERVGIVLEAGARLFAGSSRGNISFVAYGT